MISKIDRRPERSRRLKAPRLVFLFFLVLFLSLQLKSQLEQPQAMLVLGGDVEREIFAADFARKHTDIPIWISSGSNPEYARWVFSEAGIDMKRLHLDYRAVDTVTNFTTLVDDFAKAKINSLYLITSEDHIRRAIFVGKIVLGSRGIHLKPIAVKSGRKAESIIKVIRDGIRAVFWLITGKTGASFYSYLKF